MAKEFTFEHAIEEAIKQARFSPCEKSRRGAVLWKPGRSQFSSGFNQPVSGICNGTEACRAVCRHRCWHAEQCAIMRSPFARGETGLEILHIKVVPDGAAVTSGPPSCGECAKWILGHQIHKVWLLHEKGWTEYLAQDFYRETLMTLAMQAEKTV